MPLGTNWGATPEEQAREYPCDRHLNRAAVVCHRAIDIDATADLVFRWLCQLRAAPYSYDLLDNLGRRSPQELTPGLERLELGQDVMTIFRIVDFQSNVHLTLRTKRSRPFGDTVVSYVIEPRDGARSRLLVKLLVGRADNVLIRSLQPFTPLGDLVMMRRQLLNLKGLAEGGGS